LNGVFLQPNPEGAFYITLAAACHSITKLLTDFAKGNIQAVIDALTPNNYTSLALVFNGLRKPPSKYPNYEQIRTTITLALENLSQGMHQHLILLDTQNKLQAVQSQADILKDMTKLKAYIESLQQQKEIFPPASVTTIAAKFKPQYIKYIQMYGYPAGGVFEIDKLSPIINSMTAAGEKVVV
jgi:hypothetical protein